MSEQKNHSWRTRLSCGALLVAWPLLAASQVTNLEEIVVTTPPIVEPGRGTTGPDRSGIAAMRAATSDSAQLLKDIPGVSLYGAGGVSSLPAIRGLADDRLRVQVDGMDLVAACPNHMNSPLSLIDPSQVENVTVFAGISPVSLGGDSIGGTIQMKSAPPKFAEGDVKHIAKGRLGGFYRSNGNARGGSASASFATESLELSYNGSVARADNYEAGGDFKDAGPGTTGSEFLSASTVASSAYETRNQNFGVAVRHERHLLQLDAGLQDIGFEGFPNQRMDMTRNDGRQLNLRYTGQYLWGVVEARVFDQKTEHEMNMGPDRFRFGKLGMPMNTDARTRGAGGQVEWYASSRDTWRFGGDYQQHTLNDWWPAAGGTMGPNEFWNIDFGRRDRIGAYAEWEAAWDEKTVTLVGFRTDAVRMNSGPVQGYDNSLPMWATDAAAFNAKDRSRNDLNWDFTALARMTPERTHNVEFGFARKSRSPNLYQRYAWSTQPMATLMNNFVGDGNGYVGNIDLKPEVAHKLSATGEWHDSDKKRWNLKLSGHYSHVTDFIDARRCDVGQCGGAANLTATERFVNLQYVNQTAAIYGFEVSGQRLIAESGDLGKFTASGVVNYLRGDNRTTGESLHNIMPLNAKLALEQRSGRWTNVAELQAVAAKTRVSGVRNEIPTPGYGLVNLRSSVDWKRARIDAGIENLFDRLYAPPLGGAYVGQGNSMSSTTIPWGVPVPGMGRSYNLALNVNF